MIKNNLSRIMGEQRLNMAELARMSGLHSGTIFNVYHHKTKQIEYKVINALCKALECEVGELFEYVEDEE